jgi:hypothetical protein
VTELINKVWDTLGMLPPIPWPALVSFTVILVLLLPHLMKLFRTEKPEPLQAQAHHEQHGAPSISAEMPWMLTNLINTDRNVQDALHMLRSPAGHSHIEVLCQKIDALTLKVEAIDKMLRRRSGRSKKLSPVPADDRLGES